MKPVISHTSACSISGSPAQLISNSDDEKTLSLFLSPPCDSITNTPGCDRLIKPPHTHTKSDAYLMFSLLYPPPPHPHPSASDM